MKGIPYMGSKRVLAPNDFILVDSWTHRSTLSATNNSKKTIEKLYWNGKGNVRQTKLF